jgi:hypothetical protein
MTAPKPNRLIVLRQVERSQWCVVRWSLREGRFSFAGRIATARPYEEARRAAVDAAAAERLPLGIRPSTTRTRRFDPQRDMQEPRP